MLKHIVMWKLTDAADIDVFAKALRSCKDLVPGMRGFEVGTRSEGLEADHDVVLVSSFDDEAALQAYLDDPHHRNVAAQLGAMRGSRAVLDYVID